MIRLRKLQKNYQRRQAYFYRLGTSKTQVVKHQGFFKFLTTAIISLVLTLVFSSITLWPFSPAIATPLLNIQPISWNVIGLDSNNVNVGPNVFMVGARVCNVGSTPASNITVKFFKDGGSSYVNLQGSDTLTLASLQNGSTSKPPGNTGSTPNNCSDFYYNLVVARNTNAYSTTAANPSVPNPTAVQYHIEASATGVGTISTPLNRELYVEKLISQNRNSVISITGPNTVIVGQTYQYTVQGNTATNGYEQLVFSANFPNILFQILSVSSTYSAPAGTTNNAIYADACGWDPIIGYTPPQGTYRSCKGPYNYPGGKTGGSFTTVYTVKVLSAGSATITNLIYDYSGSSYHYNSDLGTGVNAITVTAVNPSIGPDLQIIKSDSGNLTLNQNGQYSLKVTNVGQISTSGTITVTDTLPTGLNYVSATGTAINGTNWNCAYNTTNRTVTCPNTGSLAINASSTISLTVTPTATGTITNTGTVAYTPTAGTLGDTNTGNNSSTYSSTINNIIDLAVTKTANKTSYNQGDAITYTITVKNNSTTVNATNAPFDDSVPSAITNVTWTCASSGGQNSCTPASGSGNSISTLVNLAKSGGTVTITVNGTVSATATGTISNTALISAPSGFTDSNTADNSATVNNNVLAPDLAIAKTHTGNLPYNQNGVFTLTVTNVGFASSSGTITVTDTLPTGLDYISATGNNNTNWTCSFNSTTRNVICASTPSTFTLAAGGSSSITLTVKRTTQDAITNTASVSNTSDKNTANNSATDVLTATVRLRLVKRITKINNTAKTGYVNSPSDPNDDITLNWPTPLTTYLQGVIDGGAVKPGDAVEYTIYFLSDGGSAAQNVTICDLVPVNSSFFSTAFNANSGIAIALSSTSLPTAPTAYLTNANTDTDGGQFYSPGTTPLPAACKSATNSTGAVVVQVVSGATTLPNATAPGTPANSYGFIRFQAKVN